MKIKFLIASIVLLFILTGCSKAYMSATASFLDFSNYAENGFFVTESNSVNFEYTPKGMVTVTVLSGYVPNTNHWMRATPKAGLRHLVEEAKSIGANGVINFKVEPYNVYDDDGKKMRDGLLVTGMAIVK